MTSGSRSFLWGPQQVPLGLPCPFARRVNEAAGSKRQPRAGDPLKWGAAGVTAQHGPAAGGAGAAGRYSRIRPCRPSPTERGRRRRGREEEVSGDGSSEEAGAQGAPGAQGAAHPEPRVRTRTCTCPPGHPRPAHLGIGQHDVLDARRPAGLGALHAHVVDLVAADLAVLAAGRGRAPQHADGRGVERLRLHLPRRRAGHWRGREGGEAGGAVTGAPGPGPAPGSAPGAGGAEGPL